MCLGPYVSWRTLRPHVVQERLSTPIPKFVDFLSDAMSEKKSLVRKTFWFSLPNEGISWKLERDQLFRSGSPP